MGNARHIKVAIQDRPARFSDLIINGTATFNSTVILDGTVTGSAVPSISPYQGVAGGSILPYQGNNSINGSAKNASILGGKNNDISAGVVNSVIVGGSLNLLQHNNSYIIGTGITSSAVNTTFVQNMDVNSTLSIPGFPDVSASLAAGGGGEGFPFTGSAAISGSLSIDGPAGHITASGNISASNTVFGITGSFSHLVGNSPITFGDPVTFNEPITASIQISSSNAVVAKELYANNTNISNPRGDGFMGSGSGEYVNTDIVFLTHQDFHLIDLTTAGENVDNIAAQRSTARSSNLFSNGASGDNRFASYVIPCGFKVTKVGVIGTEGTFNVRATSIAAASQQNCFAEGAAQSITTSPPADTFAGYLGMATALGGEAAIIPSASLAGGLGNYININVIGTAAVYGGVIVLERI